MMLVPAHREVMNLVYYQDKSIEEVTKIVAVPTNTVKTRMFYARRQLVHGLWLCSAKFLRRLFVI